MSCTIQDIINSRYANQMGALRSMGVPDSQLIALFCPQLEHDQKHPDYVDSSEPPVVVVSSGVSDLSDDPYDSFVIDPAGDTSLYVSPEPVAPVSEDPLPPGYLGVGNQDDPDAYTLQEMNPEKYEPQPGAGRVGISMALVPTVITYVTTNWGWISAALQAAGVFITVDAALELLGGTGITNVDDIVESILSLYFAGSTPGLSDLGGLNAAPGWKPKAMTKYVRGQQKSYTAMYKPMKTFTNAEKNAYSMGHRVASVWWSKALRRAKRRSYRAGRRKMQMHMLMQRGLGGNQIMVDT